MNGQVARRLITRAIARSVEFDRVIETGTYRGATTAFLAETFGVPISSVEAVPRYREYAGHRLADEPLVTLDQGDSREFLRKQAGVSGGTVFFYLDAHWEGDLPLAEELDIVAAAWRRAVVMIDDFKVPGDPGYGYDDYGPGKALTEDYLPKSVAGWSRYYPTTLSDGETGARRGCVVLTTPGIDLEIPELRRCVSPQAS
jgi:hypothetical protein